VVIKQCRKCKIKFCTVCNTPLPCKCNTCGLLCDKMQDVGPNVGKDYNLRGIYCPNKECKLLNIYKEGSDYRKVCGACATVFNGCCSSFREQTAAHSN